MMFCFKFTSWSPTLLLLATVYGHAQASAVTLTDMLTQLKEAFEPRTDHESVYDLDSTDPSLLPTVQVKVKDGEKKESNMLAPSAHTKLNDQFHFAIIPALHNIRHTNDLNLIQRLLAPKTINPNQRIRRRQSIPLRCPPPFQKRVFPRLEILTRPVHHLDAVLPVGDDVALLRPRGSQQTVDIL